MNGNKVWFVIVDFILNLVSKIFKVKHQQDVDDFFNQNQNQNQIKS